MIASLSTQIQKDCLALVNGCIGKSSNHEDCKDINVNASTRLSLNQKGYVQIKTNNPEKPNEKVQLHQLILWNHPDHQTRTLCRTLIVTSGNEVSHLCHNPLCATAEHLWAEESEINKSRRWCEINVVHSRTLLAVCRHSPKCIFTLKKQRNMLVFEDSNN